MGDKTLIVAAWSGILILIHGWIDGDIPELLSIVGSPKTIGAANVAHPGFIFRLIGEVGFATVLALIAEYSDDGANVILAFLLGLSLLLAVNNGAQIPAVSAKFLG